MVYYQNQGEGYVAADRRDLAPYSLTKVILKFVVLIMLNIPYHVQDFIRAYIWCPKKSIKSRVVLVTGGGNGLGRALCLRFAKEGCAVAVVDVDLEWATKTVDEIRKMGMRAEAFPTDVSDARAVQKLRKQVETALGPVQILVNNAGLLSFAYMNDGSDEDIQKIINVNLASHFWMIRQFLPGMQQRKEGHIVGISSVLGMIPNFRTIAYSATKYGVRGMMASLSDELFFNGFSDSIFTTCVYPDLVATRKELLDSVKELGISAQALSPKEAADFVVDGILRNKTDIIVANFPVPLGLTFAGLASTRLRRLYTKSIVRHTAKRG